MHLRNTITLHTIGTSQGEYLCQQTPLNPAKDFFKGPTRVPFFLKTISVMPLLD